MSPDTPAAEPANLSEEMPSVLAMALLFIVSIGLALWVAPTYAAQNLQAFEDPESLVNPLYYLAIVVGFTVLILLIAKWGRQRLIQLIILGAVFATLNYVFWPFLLQVIPGVAGAASMAVSLALVALLYWYPEWYVIDSVGVLVAAGAAAIFGISFGILPSLALLIGFALYDAIAVYRTKHMLDLADNVLELRLPIMLVVPKERGYSFLRETRRLKEKLDDGEPREAMFMGLGDVVIPGVLVVSAHQFLPATANPVLWGLGGPMVVALATLIGTLAGYALLMSFVLRGNPQAGLPSLNGGAIAGFLLALLPLYGLAPLIP